MKLVSLLPVAALPFAALVSGCYVQAEAGTLTRFEGTPVSQTIPYASGQAVHIISANGNVKVAGSSSTSEVTVKFSPFTMDKDDNEAGAKNAMNTRLHLIAETETSGEIVLKVTREDGSSGYLGADIEVGLPSGFDGGFEVDQNNGEVTADLRGGVPASTDVQDTGGGSVTVYGAAGPLTIETQAGDASVSVQAWSASDGSIRAVFSTWSDSGFRCTLKSLSLSRSGCSTEKSRS